MQGVLFVSGICVGSFANVLIDRLPRGEDVFRGRSHCDFCKKNLRWFELIPIVSFFVQGGRCRRCRKRLSIQYPLVELVMGMMVLLLGLFVVHATLPYQYVEIIGLLLVGFALLVIVVSALKYEIIPDSMVVLGLIGAGLLLLSPTPYPLNQPLTAGGPIPFFLSGFGASLFFLFLWFITGGRGMGLGDVKLVFLLGLLTGFPKIVIALYCAFLTGAAVGIILMVAGKKKLKSHVPFGPFLVFGTVIATVYGDVITQWWSTLL